MSVRSDEDKAADQRRISLEYQEEANLNARRKALEGVVVTPVEVVDFQIRSTIEKIKEAYGVDADEGVEWLDPFGGTGIYTARLLQTVDLPPHRKAALARNCVVIEICPLAAQRAADNLLSVAFEETGEHIEIRVLNADTFTLPPGADLWSDEHKVVRPQMKS